MVVCEEEQMVVHGTKRARVESEPDSPESKRVRSEPAESERVKDDDVADSGGVGFPDLLGILSDSDESTEGDSAIQDLDSVIKSLQDELNQPPATETEVSPASLPDLGYLLEASDDELGLPPVTSSPAKEAGAAVSAAAEVGAPGISPENVNFGQMFEFEDEFTRYEYGIVDEDSPASGEFVLDELFPSEERQPSDQSELPWQRELTRNPTALTG